MIMFLVFLFGVQKSYSEMYRIYIEFEEDYSKEDICIKIFSTNSGCEYIVFGKSNFIRNNNFNNCINQYCLSYAYNVDIEPYMAMFVSKSVEIGLDPSAICNDRYSKNKDCETSQLKSIKFNFSFLIFDNYFSGREVLMIIRE